MKRLSRELKPCKECQENSSQEFRKVLQLKNSGIVIYKYEDQVLKSSNKSAILIETFLLHNTTSKDIKRPEVISELCQYKTKCTQCKTFVQHVRNLLDELAEVKSKQIVGVCRYCKQLNKLGKCKRCEFVTHKFFSHKVKQYEDEQKSLTIWLDKIKALLQSIIGGEHICKHTLNKGCSFIELERLLQEVEKPLKRDPKIEFSLEGEKLPSLVSVTEEKEMLKKLITKMKIESTKMNFKSDENLNICSSKNVTACLCKYIIKKNNDELKSLNTIAQEDYKLKNLISDCDSKGKQKPKKAASKILEHGLDIKNQTNRTTSKITKDKKIKLETDISKGKENIKPNNFKAKSLSKLFLETTSPKEVKQSLDKHFVQLLKTKKPKTREQKEASSYKLPKFAELPVYKHNTEEYFVKDSASTAECEEDRLLTPLEMVKGAKIVPLHTYHEDDTKYLVQPILFQVSASCTDPVLIDTTNQNLPRNSSLIMENEIPTVSSKGVIKYELSNKEFIEKGWTQLPTMKIMRKMYIYKMSPAYPQYDWFERHRSSEDVYYDTGEKLADFDSEGNGKWYYKNGRVALQYYKTQESNDGQRCIIYNSGEENNEGKLKSVIILGSFDFKGNGVVYDHFGKIRLKYNQSEGVALDQKIGPPGRWKWHTLNDPPLIHPVYIDTHVDQQDCLKKVLKKEKDEKFETNSRSVSNNTDMLEIELENFVKEKAHKMLQKFKPFQHRIKVLKLNNQFSLRILDQANIYVLYREGHTSIKLNLGMVLISNEILDTITVEMSDVATPYDRNQQRTQSEVSFQNSLENVGKIENIRKSY